MKKTIALLILMGLFVRHAHAQSQNIIGNPIALQQSTTGESSHVFKSTGGYMYGLGATTSAAGWLLAYNAATVPSNGTVTPYFCAQLAANVTQYFPFSFPMPLSTGITLAFSSTGCFTQTLANAFFQAQVR